MLSLANDYDSTCNIHTGTALSVWVRDIGRGQKSRLKLCISLGCRSCLYGKSKASQVACYIVLLKASQTNRLNAQQDSRFRSDLTSTSLICCECQHKCSLLVCKRYFHNNVLRPPTYPSDCHPLGLSTCSAVQFSLWALPGSSFSRYDGLNHGVLVSDLSLGISHLLGYRRGKRKVQGPNPITIS